MGVTDQGSGPWKAQSMRIENQHSMDRYAAVNLMDEDASLAAAPEGMVQTVAQVVENGAGRAILRAERESACSSCHAAKGCGVSNISKLFSAKGLKFEADEIEGARPGDWYVVGITQGALLKAALVVYLAPMLGLLAAAITASLAGMSDGWVALAAAGGLAAGLAAARAFAASPRIVLATQPNVLAPLNPRSAPDSVCHVAE